MPRYFRQTCVQVTRQPNRMLISDVPVLHWDYKWEKGSQTQADQHPTTECSCRPPFSKSEASRWSGVKCGTKEQNRCTVMCLVVCSVVQLGFPDGILGSTEQYWLDCPIHFFWKVNCCLCHVTVWRTVLCNCKCVDWISASVIYEWAHFCKMFFFIFTFPALSEIKYFVFLALSFHPKQCWCVTVMSSQLASPPLSWAHAPGQWEQAEPQGLQASYEVMQYPTTSSLGRFILQDTLSHSIFLFVRSSHL